MKHLPRVPGRPEALCGGAFPSTTMSVTECDCVVCLTTLGGHSANMACAAFARLVDMTSAKKKEGV